jgi:phosphoglycolate phosphatase
MPAATVVFDLDGTLIDTAPDLIDTLNFVLQREGIEPLALDAARPMIGFGVRVLLERGFDALGRSVAPADMDRMFDAYIEHYAGRIAKLSRPYPGLEDALDTLSAEGFTLAVCTNKLEWLSVKLLDELGLASRFAAICGQDTFRISKPDPVILNRTIEKAGGDPNRAVMVGDSVTDLRTARAAGIPAVLVDFGHLDQAGKALCPDRTISHFDELPGAVSELLGRAAAQAQTPLIGNLR